MKKLFILSLLMSVTLSTSLLSEPSKTVPSNIENYLKFYANCGNALGKPGNWLKGEIQIVQDPSEIQNAENSIKKLLMVKGLSEASATEYSRIGVIAQDTYFIWIRDPVLFPSGKYGTYDRIIHKSNLNGPPGVAVLPIVDGNKIVTILNFRHATRSWCIELPRGMRYAAESLEKAAIRELTEETGYVCSSATFLGQVASDSGILATKTPVYLTKPEYRINSTPDYSEAISATYEFTKEELKLMFKEGSIELVINGEKHQVDVEDPILSYAIMQAESHGIL